MLLFAIRTRGFTKILLETLPPPTLDYPASRYSSMTSACDSAEAGLAESNACAKDEATPTIISIRSPVKLGTEEKHTALQLFMQNERSKQGRASRQANDARRSEQRGVTALREHIFGLIRTMGHRTEDIVSEKTEKILEEINRNHLMAKGFDETRSKFGNNVKIISQLNKDLRNRMRLLAHRPAPGPGMLPPTPERPGSAVSSLSETQTHKSIKSSRPSSKTQHPSKQSSKTGKTTVQPLKNFLNRLVSCRGCLKGGKMPFQKR